MHSPALAGMGQPIPDNPFTAMKLYADLGFFTMPATYRDKTPHPRVGPWGPLLNQMPLTSAQIDGLGLLAWMPFNVAILCDGSVTVVDIDNLDFVNWFHSTGPERLGTWIVGTPRGGLHVYLRSQVMQTPTVIKAASGVKIADLKGRGGYVIAPPSVGANGEYATEYGSPETLARVPNATEWINALVARWTGTQPVPISTMNDAPNGKYDDDRIQGEPPLAEQQALLHELEGAWHARRIPPAVYRTIVGEPTDGYWKNPGDRSDVDFGCVKELIKLDWLLPKVEMLYSFADVGEYCYRNAKRPNHGHGYLERTYDNASKRAEKERIDAENTVGGNFRLALHPTPERWVESGVVHYRYSLECVDPPRTYEIEHTGRAFGSPQRFKDAWYDQGFIVDLGSLDSAKELARLARLVDGRAVLRDVPESATSEGLIRAAFRTFLRQHLAAVANPDAKVWIEGDEVYVRTYWLRRYMVTLRPIPTPPEQWREWERLGGSALGAEGAVWKAPRASFPELS